MKKALTYLGAVLIFLTLTACNSNSGITTVKEGTYVLQQTATNVHGVAHITISKKDISFTYDALNSYLPHGTYTIKDDILTMSTSDGKYKYLFKVDGEKLIFKKDGSSEVKLTDDRFGIKITDNSEFKLKKTK